MLPLKNYQEENTEQQALFEAKVSELAEAASKICLLEESVTRHLGRQRELEDKLAVRHFLLSTVVRAYRFWFPEEVIISF